ncbi:unnamed protein product [Arabis nemorensis]|uniref:Uncharacterized protein n=1 Tax=Arabis nemorensis TaxID=586526 RepID=A0A565CBP2_9BRAS|nr:unnamed protein product [Arabis nemorensis]
MTSFYSRVLTISEFSTISLSVDSNHIALHIALSFFPSNPILSDASAGVNSQTVIPPEIFPW